MTVTNEPASSILENAASLSLLKGAPTQGRNNTQLFPPTAAQGRDGIFPTLHTTWKTRARYFTSFDVIYNIVLCIVHDIVF